MSDLNKAIEMEETILDLHPKGHLDHGTALGNLAQSLTVHYQREKNLIDLNKAIGLQERQLELYLPSHQKYGLALWALGTSLHYRYNEMKNPSDLIQAIKLLQTALPNYPAQHHFHPPIIDSLATTILLLFKSPERVHYIEQSPPPLNEAFDVYRLLKKCGSAVSLDLWEAAQAWVQNAEEYNHPSVLEAYQTALNTHHHFTTINSSLDAQHETLQARAGSLASDAFSCAIKHKEFQMAVELLEQGRGILWNQLAYFDISTTALESAGGRGHELGQKLKQLSEDLKKHAGQCGDNADPYWRVLEEWESVVSDIRDLDGFSRFLLPRRFKDLQRAAEDGPVVIVNASKYTCDALIILPTRAPIHVDIPFSLSGNTQICLDLETLTRWPYAFGENRESHVKQVLRDLWSYIVEPIVTVLRDDVQLPQGSRIWWYPSSMFKTFPLHAAGPYLNSRTNLIDVYVSSYTPSLSALFRTRNRLRSQRKACNSSSMPRTISFAAIGQGRPSANTRLPMLSHVELELSKICAEAAMHPGVKFKAITGDAATVEGVIQAFRDHRWIHMACHGAQHTKKPFDSMFALGDGKLTLMRIIQERYTESEFAFLSACDTAVGDASTPDEVLHLAAGMQFAGFNGVVGSLWRVDDMLSHQVVARFYKEMFKHPEVDLKHAAAALNTALVETDEIPLEKRIVFVHIGI